MIPGRSLSANTIGRSWAPVATTMCRARIRQTRWRRQVRRCVAAEVVGAPLEGEHEPVVVVAERGGALQVQDIGVAGQFGDRGGDPLERGGAVDAVGAAAAARRRPRTARRPATTRAPARAAVERGGQARRAGADDQHVGVDVLGVVAGGVGDLGEPALPGDAAGDQAVVQLDGGGQQHRLGERLLDLDQAAGVLGPGGGDAARAAELDAGGDLVDAVGQQRRGQGVTGVAGECLAVEGEVECGGAVDAAAGWRCGMVLS